MTLTISINRASLSLAPLVLSGSDGGSSLGITDYSEPAIQPRILYAPDSAYESGSTPLAVAFEDTIVGFAVCTTTSTTEAASRSLIAELVSAVSQFSYTVTVTVDGAPAETWTCRTGAVAPVGGRTYSNLRRHNPEWSVTIPAHPVRTYV